MSRRTPRFALSKIILEHYAWTKTVIDRNEVYMMHSVFILAGKDIRLLLRDKAGFFFTFFFPLIYASFFGMIFSGIGSGKALSAIEVAVVDEDNSEGSRAFIAKLEASEELKVNLMNRAKAEDAVRRGKGGAAYVILGENFGVEADCVFFGGKPSIEVGIDPARGAEGAMLEGLLARHLYANAQESLLDKNKMSGMIDDSLDNLAESEDVNPLTKATMQAFLPALRAFIETTPTEDLNKIGGATPASIERAEIKRDRTGQPNSSFEITFPQGIAWGVLGCTAAFGLSLVIERTNGTLVRLRMTPVGVMRILAGKMLACFVTTLGMIILLLLFSMIVFKVRPDSYALLLLAAGAVCVCFSGLMLFLSTLGKTEQAAGSIAWAVLLIMAMIGGGMVPVVFMPGFMKAISIISPVRWGIVALEGAIWRNYSAGEMFTPIAVLIGVGILFFGLGMRTFRWSK